MLKTGVKRFFNSITPERLFWIIMIINIVIMYMIIWSSKGSIIDRIGYYESFFSDFWVHANRLLFNDKIYGTGDADAIFPPLAYCIMMIFIYPLEYKSDAGLSISDISKSGFGTLMFVMFIGLFCCLFTQQVLSYYHTNVKAYKVIAPFLFILSHPFWRFAFERGNMTLYSMIFLWFSLVNYDNKDKRIRELSMISLAIAAGIKLYPAVFGLLWIRDKRYKDAIRLVIYGLIAFIAPFYILNKGTVFDYLLTFQKYISKGVIYPPSILGNMVELFGTSGRYVGYVVEVIWISWMLFFMFSRKNDWKTITLLMSTQTIMIPEAYMYTYVYIVIACIMFLNKIQIGHSKIDYIYAILFAIVFSAVPITSRTVALQFEMYVSWVLILLIISISEIYSFITRKRCNEKI